MPGLLLCSFKMEERVYSNQNQIRAQKCMPFRETCLRLQKIWSFAKHVCGREAYIHETVTHHLKTAGANINSNEHNNVACLLISHISPANV